ncbi:conserved protein of unknown function [Tenacibaculum sp. 190130A14a]|uniref:DNA primase n=1 Tax=Tenacibaculum polynesiense TaxID=3137857 RepID=A0ABM9P7U5_9FLAO
MQPTIKDLKDKIFDVTNGGLDIIVSLYPQVNERSHFKIREGEKTASSSLKKLDDGIYILKDWGQSEKAKNAIQLYADFHGLEFVQALLQLAKNYQIPTSNQSQVNNASFKSIDLSAWDKDQEFDDNNFCFETKDFTEFELSTLGPFVDDKTCNKYNLFSLSWYAVKKEGKIKIVESTDTYPIFIFCFTNNKSKFYKILQPKCTDKQYRFFWKGKKSIDFVGGLKALESEFSKRKAQYEIELQDESKSAKAKLEKIDKVFLCSGERDALNMASLGYFVLWLNSETAELTTEQLKRIYNCSDELYNIPDLDETGKREGFSRALKYLDIKTIWLPNYLRNRRDWRGNPRKDLCDFFELNKNQKVKSVAKKVKTMIKTTYPMRFWDMAVNDKGRTTYTYNNVHALNFLYRNGFCRLNVEEDKDGFKFVYVNEHIVKEIKSIEVKDFVFDFLEKRNIETAIRNMMYNTTRLSDNQIAALPRVDLDFKSFDQTFQLFYFSNQFWKITKEGITPYTKNTHNKYVWRQQIIDQKVDKLYAKKIDNRSIKLEHNFFDIKKVEENYTIEVKEENCEFLNFLINISRIHWRKELEEGFKNEEEKQDYWKKNLFNISGDKLDQEEKLEQQAHLVNKLFTIGYLLHGYKQSSKAWAVYAIENEVVDDNESHGGSGKSLFLKALQIILDQKYIEARNNRIWEDKHLFEGVTKHTGYVLFDDANKEFKFNNLYSSITGPMNVNPKNNQPYTIPFNDAPKIAISSNYSLREADPSTTRRILFTAVSDYYHAESEIHPIKRDPKDDFGHELFRHWDDDQFNKVFNLFAQCVQFYLSVDEKINPPMNKIRLRNLQAEMGGTFIDWADDYLNNHLDIEFNKNAALEDIKSKKQALRNITSTKFVKKIKAWCEFNGHLFMPKAKTDSAGRIQKKNETGKREDFLFIERKEGVVDISAGGEPEELFT